MISILALYLYNKHYKTWDVLGVCVLLSWIDHKKDLKINSVERLSCRKERDLQKGQKTTSAPNLNQHLGTVAFH